MKGNIHLLKNLFGFFFILVFLLSPTKVSRAAGPWYVAPGGDDSGPCTSPASACATINEAAAKASPGDTIYVATGTYTHDGDAVMGLTKDVTLSGGWNSEFTVQTGASTIDGQSTRCVIAVNPQVAATIEHFIIQNGAGGGYCGGIAVSMQAHVTLNAVEILNSTQSVFGAGGLYNDSGTVIVNNSVIAGNAGGVNNEGWMTVTNSIVENNSGMGIINKRAMTLDGSIVSGNSGGISNYAGTLTLNNTTVIGNASNGIDNIGWAANLFLNNSTVSGNAGAGMTNQAADITLNNVTITGNGSVGITTMEDYSPVTIQNTIIAGNLTDCGGPITTLGYNIIGTTSGCTFTPGDGDLTNIDPHLAPLMGGPVRPNYHPLLPGSPAIDAGNPTGCTGTGGVLSADQRGAARVGRCDIGAYEYTIPGAPGFVYAYRGTPQNALALRAFRQPLQAAVLDNAGSPVDNISIALEAPESGASGTFGDTGTRATTAITGEDGIATAATFYANGSPGTYTVTGTVGSLANPAHFILTNYAVAYLPIIRR